MHAQAGRVAQGAQPSPWIFSTTRAFDPVHAVVRASQRGCMLQGSINPTVQIPTGSCGFTDDTDLHTDGPDAVTCDGDLGRENGGLLGIGGHGHTPEKMLPPWTCGNIWEKWNVLCLGSSSRAAAVPAAGAASRSFPSDSSD